MKKKKMAPKRATQKTAPHSKKQSTEKVTKHTERYGVSGKTLKRFMKARVEEKPSLAQKLWDAEEGGPLRTALLWARRRIHFFLLTKRLGASKERAEAVVDRQWQALPLWARRGLKRHAANKQKKFLPDWSPQEADYYGEPFDEQTPPQTQAQISVAAHRESAAQSS